MSLQDPAKPPVPAAPVIQTIIVPAPNVQVRAEAAKQDHPLTDPSTYAAGIPGLLVAVAGFWVVHILARRRDREKRFADLCQSVMELADKAAHSASAAWTAAKGPKRQQLINQAKQDFQTLGVAVTRVRGAASVSARRHSFSDAWNARSLWIFFSRRSVSLTNELKTFRVAALHDPFDDPARGPDHDAVLIIHTELASFTHALDAALNRCLP